MICISYLVYSQIWLDLHKDDDHFFYIFVWMIAILATNKNAFKTINKDQGSSFKFFK